MAERADRVVGETGGFMRYIGGSTKIGGLWTSLEKGECPVSPFRLLRWPPRPYLVVLRARFARFFYSMR